MATKQKEASQPQSTQKTWAEVDFEKVNSLARGILEVTSGRVNQAKNGNVRLILRAAFNGNVELPAFVNDKAASAALFAAIGQQFTKLVMLGLDFNGVKVTGALDEIARQHGFYK